MIQENERYTVIREVKRIITDHYLKYGSRLPGRNGG